MHAITLSFLFLNLQISICQSLLRISLIHLIVVSHLLLLWMHCLLWHHLHGCSHVSWNHSIWLSSILHGLLLLLEHLLWHLLDRLSEHIDIAWVLHVVKQDAHLGFTDTFLLQEVLHWKQIDAHLTSLLHELFTLLNEVWWYDTSLIGCRSHW